MPLVLTPWELALRVVCAFIASALVGINRGERGRPAGLRTTILVGMAAAFSMLMCNAVLDTTGKTPSSFSVMDVMRLPLGVLSGVGFLGAGAILRKGRAVIGLTTAATLWFVTMMGFCFGTGLYLMGGVALFIALLVLWGLKKVEDRLQTDRRGNLVVTTEQMGFDERELQSLFARDGFRVVSSGVNAEGFPRTVKLTFELRWSATGREDSHPAFIDDLIQRPEIKGVDWAPQRLVEKSED